jgi:hypothetical protein
VVLVLFTRSKSSQKENLQQEILQLSNALDLALGQARKESNENLTNQFQLVFNSLRSNSKDQNEALKSFGEIFRQNVQDFNFFPGNEDLILMHLDEGIYLVEIDDRAWQNTQLLYPGRNLIMLVDGNSIFIKDGDIIVEALTELIIP